GAVHGLDNFSLGLLVMMLVTQEGLKRRFTSKHIMLAGIGLLICVIMGDLTYTDLARYAVLLGTTFAEMNSGGDVMHLALVATFKVKPAYLLGFLFRMRWSPRESFMLVCGAILMQTGMGVLACHHMMDYVHACALGWLLVRSLVVPGMVSKALPLLCCLAPLPLAVMTNATRASVATLAVGTMLAGAKGKSVKKSLPWFSALIASWMGCNPLGMMVFASFMRKHGKR
nr:nonstructural protein NS2A [Donggang virus]